VAKIAKAPQASSVAPASDLGTLVERRIDKGWGRVDQIAAASFPSAAAPQL
jgi:hypothetical protein